MDFEVALSIDLNQFVVDINYVDRVNLTAEAIDIAADSNQTADIEFSFARAR